MLWRTLKIFYLIQKLFFKRFNFETCRRQDPVSEAKKKKGKKNKI